MKDYKKALKYTNLYLTWKPRDVNKLFIKAISLEELKQIKESLLVYKRILELQPYNNKAKDSILELENIEKNT
jgi:tetratricopeptide (TPR) repeat protein